MNLIFGKLNPSGEPVYLQIIRNFKQLILQGQIKDGDEVPSRRILAAQLGVNPNTVQKAFAELEKEQLIQTPPNAKSVVLISNDMLTNLRVELLETHVTTMVDAAIGVGITLNELVKMISKDWEKRGAK